jgi:glycosyltransferase involved in cell wall biosynthesis
MACIVSPITTSIDWRERKMTDSLQLYGSLLAAFCEYIPSYIFGDVRRLMVLAWAVVGLCLTKTVNFNLWGEVVISQAQYAGSHQRRFQRLLKNKRVKPVKYYAPLLRAAIRTWSWEQTLYLALDVSVLPKGYILIRLALIYRGRAIPVTWRVMKHNSATVSYKDYKVVLKQALLILPKGQSVILLADRGFVHAKLVKFCRQHQWGYRLRAKSSTLIRLPDRRVASFGRLCPSKGHAHFYQGIHILGENIGPVNIALANPEDDDDPWYIISNDLTSLTTLDEYALRFDIEEGFLDDKSGGFQVESSKLDEAQAIARLFLVLAIATLHFTSVGVAVVKRKARRWVDTHWDRCMSYLKIGWQWLRQQFRKNWPVLPPFGLDPDVDPEPAIASRRQAAQPKRQWIVSCFGVP